MKKYLTIFFFGIFLLGVIASGTAVGTATVAETSKVNSVPSVINVGFLGAMTGALEDLAPGFLDGALSAAREVNQSSDFSFDIHVIVGDTKLNPTDGVAAYESLKAQGVQLVIGATGSSVSKAVAEKTAVDKIVQISYSSTAESLSSDSYPYFYRTVPSDAFQAEAVAHLLENKTKLVIVNVANAWGDGLAAGVADKFNGTVLETINYQDTTTDFSSVSTSVKAATGADAILLISYVTDGRAIISQLRADGVTTDLFGTDGTGDQAMVNATIAPNIVSDIDGFRGTVPHQFKSGEANYNGYVSALSDCYGAGICTGNDSTRVYGDYAYDAMWVGANAVKLAGDYSGTAIKDKMDAAGKAYNGATGNKEFNKFGDPLLGAYDFYQFKDGSYKVIGYYGPNLTPSTSTAGNAPGFELATLFISLLSVAVIVTYKRKRRN